MAVSQATRAFGSSSRIASSTASEIWSQILSGCPSVTDSEVRTRRSVITVLSGRGSAVVRQPPARVVKGDNSAHRLALTPLSGGTDSPESAFCCPPGDGPRRLGTLEAEPGCRAPPGAVALWTLAAMVAAQGG